MAIPPINTLSPLWKPGAAPRPSTFCSRRFSSISLSGDLPERSSFRLAIPSPQKLRKRRRSFRLPPISQVSEGISDALFWHNATNNEQNYGWFERAGKRVGVFSRKDLSNGDSFLFASPSPREPRLYPQVRNGSLLVQMLKNRVFSEKKIPQSIRMTELRMIDLRRKLNHAGCRVPAIYNADNVQSGEQTYFLVEEIARPIRVDWSPVAPIRSLCHSQKRLLLEVAVMMKTCYQAYLLPHIRPDHVRWTKDGSLALVHLIPYPGKGKTRDECFEEMIRTFSREGSEIYEFLNNSLQEKSPRYLAKLLGINRRCFAM